ncbi:uncharacterized protein PAE49_008868 isoform 3-T3 [Odontesthes bonariensis]
MTKEEHWQTFCFLNSTTTDGKWLLQNRVTNKATAERDDPRRITVRSRAAQMDPVLSPVGTVPVVKRTPVSRVGHHSPLQRTSKDTKQSSADRNHSAVDKVRKASHQQVSARFMSVFTLRSSSAATPVGLLLISPPTLNMNCSTVTGVLQCSSQHLLWLNISRITKSRNNSQHEMAATHSLRLNGQREPLLVQTSNFKSHSSEFISSESCNVPQ